MTGWGNYRNQWSSPRAAVENASIYEGWETLKRSPLVQQALLQIDAAERVIASVADEMQIQYHDGEDDE